MNKKYFNQFNAYLKGKKPKVTVPNPNKNETNKLFIKVDARDVWQFANKPYSMANSKS